MVRIALIVFTFLIACSPAWYKTYEADFMRQPLIFSVSNGEAGPAWSRANEMLQAKFNDFQSADLAVSGSLHGGRVTVAREVSTDSTLFRVKWSGYEGDMEPLAHRVAYYMVTGKSQDDYRDAASAGN